MAKVDNFLVDSSEENTDTTRCTVGLLANAASSAYWVKENNLIDPTEKKAHDDGLKYFATHGYAITKTIAPKASHGTGNTPLAAVCIEPNKANSTAPIIIAFRGTKTAEDVRSDVSLGLTGTVEEKFRDAAFEFYREIAKNNPNRKIILTGHSLGGHLVQYVATRAYHQIPELCQSRNLRARTFNSAPISTTHAKVFKEHPSLKGKIVNYRLSRDIVSAMPYQQYYGNVFSFISHKKSLASHKMSSIKSELPPDVLSLDIGQDNPKSQFIELAQGIKASYQCRINDQIFAKYRAGSENLKIIQQGIPDVLTAINKNDFGSAKDLLSHMYDSVSGKISKKMLKLLGNDLTRIKNSFDAEKSKGAYAQTTLAQTAARNQVDRFKGNISTEDWKSFIKDSINLSHPEQIYWYRRSLNDRVSRLNDILEFNQFNNPEHFQHALSMVLYAVANSVEGESKFAETDALKEFLDTFNKKLDDKHPIHSAILEIFNKSEGEPLTVDDFKKNITTLQLHCQAFTPGVDTEHQLH